MHFAALALDYDGTIALEGSVADSTARALRLIRESGRKLVLVTGRIISDLVVACDVLDHFRLRCRGKRRGSLQARNKRKHSPGRSVLPSASSTNCAPAACCHSRPARSYSPPRNRKSIKCSPRLGSRTRT